MAAWVVITAEDLNDYLVGAQMAALRRIALASGQSDPFGNVMHDRASYVRNRISKKISISLTPYAVPPELKTQTCQLIIEAMQGRIPQLNLTEDQRTAIRRAYKDLDIAGTEDLPISTPDDPTDPEVQSGGAISIVTKPRNNITRNTMRGL